MGIESTEFQDDLQAWLDDEMPKMRLSDCNLIKRVLPGCIDLLPKFVMFMTVEELLQVIDDLGD